MRKFLMGALILFSLTSAACAAENWEVINFDENLNSEILELEEYCLLHDMTIEDVLWANRMERSDIKPGNFVYLPPKKSDMLFVWQDRVKINSSKQSPAQQKIALVPQTKTEAPAAPAQVVTAQSAAKATPAEFIASQQAAKPTSSQADKTTPAEFIASQQRAPAKTDKTTPAEFIASQQATPAKTDKTTPAKFIASTTSQKPDKILANAKKKDEAKNNSIPGLMDPVIILSPNGDASSGPMRLVITGNKVEVVRLPQSAAPKKPSVADLNNSLGNVPGYVPYYNMIPLRPRNNRANNNKFFTNELNGKMLWPLDGRVSSYFGPRGKHNHEGIDIAMPGGTPIKAAKNGVVARTGNNSTMGFRGYGNFVLLDHGNGLQTFYAHCSKVAVVPGQRIMQGQVVGYVGSTGRSTGNHLHFEVRVNNVKVNPIPYLAGRTQLASK